MCIDSHVKETDKEAAGENRTLREYVPGDEGTAKWYQRVIKPNYSGNLGLTFAFVELE